MNREQAVALTKLVQAACPQQAIDKFTPKVWFGLMDDLDFIDCQEAVQEIGRRQPFISPAEIRAEVKRVRADRIARSLIPAPPPELTDHPRAYQRHLQAGITEAAEGRAPLAADQPAVIVGSDTPRAITGGRPAQLGSALADLKRRLGPARARSQHLASPQEIARRQAAESRQQREAREAEERGEAS